MTWKERREALRAQIQTGDGKAAVLACLKDTNRRVRQEGVRNSEPFLTDSDVRDALIGLLTDRSIVVVREVSPLVVSLGLSAAPPLLAVCRTASGERLTLAANSLAAIAQERPDPGLRQGASQLRKRARGWFLSPSVKTTLNRCADQIDGATESVKDLPRSALRGESWIDLPTPSNSRIEAADSLPSPSTYSEKEATKEPEAFWLQTRRRLIELLRILGF